jgi:hypothetical protein
MDKMIENLKSMPYEPMHTEEYVPNEDPEVDNLATIVSSFISDLDPDDSLDLDAGMDDLSDDDEAEEGINVNVLSCLMNA